MTYLVHPPLTHPREPASVVNMEQGIDKKEEEDMQSEEPPPPRSNVTKCVSLEKPFLWEEQVANFFAWFF